MNLQQPISPRSVLILGFGVTGMAVCDFALKHKLSVAVSEFGQLSSQQQAWLRERNIPFEQSGHTSAFVSQANTMILSPGVPLSSPILGYARDLGLAVISETDFALSQISQSCRVIAVTGTNGKSSTVEVIAAILNSQGYRAHAAGNIGIPLISLVDEIEENDTLVMEMSSYQLEQSVNFQPDVALLLTFTPDHLHRHKTLHAYASAKSRILANQTPDNIAILPKALVSQFQHGMGRRVIYDEAYSELPAGAEALFPHEQSNLRAALAACHGLYPEIDTADIPMDEVCETFRLPHRLQSLGFVNGVQIINDSKSTNAGSTMAALRAMTEPVVLLLGGCSKGAGYEALAVACQNANLRAVILFGEAANELQAIFRESSTQSILTVVDSMESAVCCGLRQAQSGDVLLLSPACSSFDAFSNYVERGEAFAKVIQSVDGFIMRRPRT